MRKLLLLIFLVFSLSACNLVFFNTDKKEEYSYNLEIDSLHTNGPLVTHAMPSKGDVKCLVIPINFISKNKSYSISDNINNAFNGSSDDIKYESVSSYYLKSSNHLLNLSFKILDWYTPNYDFSYYESYSKKQETGVDILLAEARESLKRTPDLLPILKEVGVVDSGGAGFCKILEGFSKALKNEVVEKNMPDVVDVSDQAQVSMGNAQSKIQHEEFGYCTEFILKLPAENEKSGKKVFVEKRFVAVLNSHGNSIVEVRDNDLVKVHIHTLNPGNILSYAQQFGEFVKIKVENMSEQHSELLKEENNKKVEEKPLKEFGLISVGVGQGIVDMFKDLRVDYVVSGGQTMNPSTEDFVEAIKEVHAKNIIILPNNSNIVMAASQACDVVSGGETNAVVIPSKTIPQGLVAAMMFNPEVDMEVNINEMTEALSTVKTGQVTFSIKDTTVDGVQVYKDQFMGIFDKEIVCCQKDKVDAAMELLDKMTDSMSSIITVIIGEDVSNEEEERITNLINEKYGSEIDIDIKKGLQPVYSFIISVE